MSIAATIGRIATMTSGALIRQARTRAGLSQVELSQRSGKDRAQIARWERDVVQPSLETLRELLRACSFDVELTLVPYEPDPKHDSRLRVRLGRTPQERLQGMLRERNR
jgi:transcriptional regulator with XRE-family HTH domain